MDRFEIEELRHDAKPFVPRNYVPKKSTPTPKPPPPPSPPTPMEIFEKVYNECKTKYEKKKFTCHKVFIRLTGNTMPGFHIKMDNEHSFYFYYDKELVHVECRAGFHTPLGANLYNWSIHDYADVIQGIDRLITYTTPYLSSYA